MSEDPLAPLHHRYHIAASDNCDETANQTSRFEELFEKLERDDFNTSVQVSPADDAPNNDASLFSCRALLGSVANLCNATLGAGVLALPYAMKQAGLLAGTALLAVTALITVASVHILVRAQDECCAFSNNNKNMNSIEGLCEFLVGRRLRMCVEACVVVFCLGCAVAYVVAVGDILELMALQLHWSRNVGMSVIWMVLMVPLSLLRTMTSLQCASGMGIASIGTLVFSSFVHLLNDWSDQAATDAHNHGNSTNYNATNITTGGGLWSVKETILEASTISFLANQHFENSTGIPLSDFLWPVNGWLSVLKACPIILFAYSCQVNVAQIYKELPDKQQMRRVTVISVSLCSFLFLSISVIAIADFGALTMPNVLQNYNNDYGMMQFACACMAAGVIMAFPLNIFPARVCLTEVWNQYAKKSVQRELVGGPDENLTAALLEDDGHHRVASRRTAVEVALASPEDLATSIVDRELDRDVSSSRDERVNMNADEDFNLVQHVTLTFVLAGLALVFALIVPNISLVFGLLGGTTASALGFVFPGILGLRLRNQGDAFTAVSAILFVGGIMISILTTAVTVYSTFA
jgi:amino acid permease